MSGAAMSDCDCVCHAGLGVLWRAHLCEHCAPGYFARRSAREQANFVRRDTVNATPQTNTGHAIEHPVEQEQPHG